MNIKSVIKDVIQDYKVQSNKNFDSSILEEALYSASLKYTDLSEGVMYATNMYFIYYIFDEHSTIGSLKVRDIEAILQKDLDYSSGKLISGLEFFAWESVSLIEVRKRSYELFDMAKDVYNGTPKSEIPRAETILQEIVDLRLALDKEDYKYGSKDSTLSLYLDELSESTLDVSMIKGENLIMSFRLRDYIDNNCCHDEFRSLFDDDLDSDFGDLLGTDFGCKE